MTVAVSCNLSDGVILGVDSAVALPGPGGFAKVYENAEKLFQLGNLPIGVAVYGLGAIGSRSLGSYLREFEVRDPAGIMNASACRIPAIVEELRKFFLDAYMTIVVPPMEAALSKPFADIPVEQRPAFGLIVGGFSAGAYLSEVWEIRIPEHADPGTAQLTRAQGDFGTNWFAMFEPIRRYIKGWDVNLVNEVLAWVESLRGQPYTPDELNSLNALMAKYEYQVPFAAMPMEEGIAQTRFLVELVINHHRFTVGAPVVGGKVKLGKVTYRGDHFELLDH